MGSVGVEFGPTLAGWGSGQDRETILKAIMEPSADLAHGYEGTELVVKGDKRIQGFIQAEGDSCNSSFWWRRHSHRSNRCEIQKK